MNGVKVPVFIIGDPSYPIQKWSMKAFTNHPRITQEQPRFNFHLLSVLTYNFNKGKMLRLEFANMQQQTGGNDCGLFALAAAPALARGEDPTELHFHQSQMRTHLMDCFILDRMAPLPSQKRLVGNKIKICSIAQTLCYRAWYSNPKRISNTKKILLRLLLPLKLRNAVMLSL